MTKVILVLTVVTASVAVAGATSNTSVAKFVMSGLPTAFVSFWQTAAPERSAIVILGTGLLFIAGALRRRMKL